MSDTAHKNADTSTSRPRRSIVMRLLRFLAFSGFGLLVLLAALIGFSETETFRSLLRDLIIDTAESSLNGQLEISSISGNLFTGWELREVSLTDHAGSIVEVESIVLRYNLFRVPWKRITIRELTLNSPRISITRAEGRDWNISTLIPPSEDEDTTTTPFDWVIVVENLRVLDGTLLVYDSTVTGMRSTTRLDPERLLFENMNLALSLTVAPDEMSLTLNRGSWSNVFGEVGMRNLSGDITLRDTSLVIEELSVQTERSALLLSASIEGVDLLGEIDEEVLRRMRIDLQLDAPTVEIRDLQYFLPFLDFLGATASLDLDIHGSFNQLHIEKLRIDALESSLAFSGELRNILDGSGMTIDAVSDRTVIHAGDLPVFLPGIPIMDLSGLGRVQFNSLLYNGTPLRFDVEMDMESDAGDIAGRMFMDLSGDELLYDATLRTRNFDPGRALNNSALAAALNVRTSIRGKGTELGAMEAAVSLNGDSTSFQGNLAHLLRASLDIERDSLHLDMESALGTSTISVQGGMSFRSDSITGFRLVADARNLDLAPLLDDEEFGSDLNFALIAHGNGIDLSTASGEVEIMLEPSWFKELRIDQDTFLVELRQHVSEPELLLVQSQYADVRLEGQFDLPRFATYMARQLDALGGALARYTLTPDIEEGAESGAARRTQGTPASLAATASPDDRPEAADDTAAFMDLRYTLTLKNPDRIARYFDASTFLLRGSWQGSIVGGLRGFDIDGEIALSDFYFVDSLRTWLAAGLNCTYEIRDLQLHQPLEHLLLSTRISAGDLHIDGMGLSRTLLEFDWRDAAPTLRLRSMVDTIGQIDLTASARHVDYGYDITIPKLELLYRGDAWRNQEQIQLRIDSAGLNLRSFDLGHGAMRLSASGQRSSEGANNFTIYADSLKIAALEYLFTGDPAAREGRSFSGIGFVEARLTGDDSAPLLAADIFIDDLGFRGAHFGQMILEARYSGNSLELYSELIYQTKEGIEEKVFFVSGSLPVGISFTGEEEEVSGEAVANLRVQMSDFPLTLIEEFLGLFSPLTGTANADITVSGTADTPSFTGFLTVTEGRGRFLFNNMEYELGLRIEAIKQDIRIIDLTIANIPSDWSAGRMSASGTISTESFAISEFDLAFNGRLKVLGFASRSVLRTIYGDLFISTGSQELSYVGRLDRSRLDGALVIERGNLLLPMEQSSGEVGSFEDITYVVVDDTTQQRVTSLSAGRFARFTATTEDDDEMPHVPEQSVLDGLTFDLVLSTSGRLNLVIPFSVLQEELNAQLEISNLKIDNWGGSGVKFVGGVTLGPDSYFIFLGKRMTASGSLRFTRDPTNPDLDLRAVYSDYYIDPATQVRRPVYVIVSITGTMDAMELNYDLRYDDVNGERVAAAADVKSDVVSFLVFGVFTKDISGGTGDRSSLADKSPEFLNQITSSLASSAATEFLTRAGLREYIKRVDFAGLGTEESRVKLTSEIGRAIITYDGRINDLESSNVSVDFPLSRVLGIPWTNLMIQISRKALNETIQSTAQTQQFSIWELKILQRFTF